MAVRLSTIAGQVASDDKRLVIVDVWMACFADDPFSLAERLAIVEIYSSTLDGLSSTMAGRVAKLDGRFSRVDLRAVGGSGQDTADKSQITSRARLTA
jgi:hypothetical protein